MKFVDSIFSLLFAFLNLLLCLLDACPFFKLLELLENDFIGDVWIHVLGDGLRVFFNRLFFFHFFSFYEGLMSKHILFVDSEDLREIEDFDLSFL